MTGQEFRDIGTNLRLARRMKKLRLRDVAERVECSESLLSKIECNKVTPSLRVLHRIVTALDTSIASLFTDHSDSDVTLYRPGTRPVVATSSSDGGPGVKLERLCPYQPERLLDANIHIIEPGRDSGGEIKHAGEEVGYLLEGQVELVVNEEVYELGPGDSFFFRSELPHRYRNVGEATAKILWINTPPTF